MMCTTASEEGQIKKNWTRKKSAPEKKVEQIFLYSMENVLFFFFFFFFFFLQDAAWILEV